ncbi:MAG: hypothetical protein SO045_04140 [Campylobacter sp.]|nr:hypothetical protein [Campylobacter sp.]
MSSRPAFVITRFDPWISSQRILKFRHCEGVKQREQSRSRLNK